jgi:hypothetical protein
MRCSDWESADSRLDNGVVRQAQKPARIPYAHLG